MPRTREVIPADALIEIARDPDRFKKMLTEFGDRQELAVAAEAKGREAEKRAENSLRSLYETENVHTDLVRADETRLDARKAALKKRAAELDERMASLNVYSDQTQERESLVTVIEDTNRATVDRLKAQAKTLDVKAEKLDDRETRLGAREAIVSAREARLAANIEKVLEGL